MTSADWSTISTFATPPLMLIVAAVVYWWKASIDTRNVLLARKSEMDAVAQAALLKAAEDDRIIARREAAENRALALQIAEQARAVAHAAMLRGDRVVGKVDEITAVIEAHAATAAVAVVETKGTLAKIGEVAADTHALLNGGKLVQLVKASADARKKAIDSGLKEDFDAAELIEVALAAHKAIQKTAHEQGGQSAEKGGASVQESARSLATPSETTPRAAEGTAPAKEGP